MNPDYRRLFESAPGCMLVMQPDFTIVAVSDAYLRATMTKREEILGRNGFEVFPDDPNDPKATGQVELRASIARMMARKEADELPILKYSIQRPEEEGGGFEERYWSIVNTPVLGPDREVQHIVHTVEDVTALVKLERQGAEKDKAFHELTLRSEERYGELLEAAPDAMIVVGQHGVITLANRQAEVLFGYPRAEMMGRSVSSLVPPHGRAWHEELMSAFLASPAQRGMGIGLDILALRKDGSTVPVEIGLSPLHSGEQRAVVAAIRDVSERLRLEAAAKRSADRLASAVEYIEEGIVLFDAERRVVMCNSTYRAIIGYAVKGPILGRTYDDLTEIGLAIGDFANDEERAQFRAKRVWEHTKETTVVELRTRDGRHLRILDQPTPEGGRIRTIWDLTSDMRREEELRKAREEADAASAAKSEFLSSMSHELRTPLNAILGFAQVLQRDKREPLSARQRERVGQILTGGDHLLRLIEDILDLSRIETGRVSVSTERIPLRDVLVEVGTTLEAMAADAGVRVEIAELPPGVREILGDRTRFSQILMNYGSNAIKYNRPGGKVTLRVSTAGSGRVRVTVADTGIGVPIDEQGNLFQPFHRAGQENGPIEGTGIGLAISRRLAALMRGTTGFRSVPNEGSEFWVELPAPSARDGLGDHESFRTSASRLGDDRRGLVLYIEDSVTNVLFMRDLLSGFDGVELVTAPSAEQGVALARIRPPDVILMDIHLPGMSGIEALEALRQWPETRKIPVIALTAAASPLEREHGERAGFARYLTKPINVADLEGTLEALLPSA